MGNAQLFLPKQVYLVKNLVVIITFTFLQMEGEMILNFRRAPWDMYLPVN